MGTDIHAAVEYRVTAEHAWQPVKFVNKYYGMSWNGDSEPTTYECQFARDYDLFAILGNVRNGLGFAGITTGAGFEPMSDNRGVPADISDGAREVLSDEHSATWVTLAEILAYDWDRTTKKTGVVSAVEFAHWEGVKSYSPDSGPSSYCGDVSGSEIKHISEQEMRARLAEAIIGKHHPRSEAGMATIEKALPQTYCRVEWTESYAKAGSQLWTYALPKMLNLGRQHGAENVRLVMDFDS